MSSYTSFINAYKNNHNRKMKKKFSINLSQENYYNKKNNNVNDILKFINTGKISNNVNNFCTENNISNNIISVKNDYGYTKPIIKRNNTLYKIKSNPNSSFFSFDKKYNNNINDSKTKYVYNNYYRVFDYNNKENIKLSRNSKQNNQEKIMESINKIKTTCFQYKKKSFIDNNSPSKKYQNTMRLNFVWNKPNYYAIKLKKHKKNSKIKSNDSLMEEIDYIKKELNKGIIKNKSGIELLMNVIN